MAARSALMKYLRVQVRPSLVQLNPNTSYAATFNSIFRRRFSDEAKGSFLDKSEVTDRVINVVKNFQKVDPAKIGRHVNGRKIEGQLSARAR